jgi:hypothetical protein
METSVIEFIKHEIKALKELKELHLPDEKLADGLIEEYEEKLKEEQKKKKIDNNL